LWKIKLFFFADDVLQISYTDTEQNEKKKLQHEILNHDLNFVRDTIRLKPRRVLT